MQSSNELFCWVLNDWEIKIPFLPQQRMVEQAEFSYKQLTALKFRFMEPVLGPLLTHLLQSINTEEIISKLQEERKYC